MAENSKIEWTDHTFNGWIGCTKVSPGCANCYAENETFTRVQRAAGRELWGKGKPRHRTSAANWRKPLQWNLKAAEAVEDALHDFGEDTYVAPPRPRVFCSSLSDWLDDEVPIEWLADLLELIRVTTNLDWQLLTKRPENWRPRMNQVYETIPDSPLWHWLRNWIHFGSTIPESVPQNVWIGTTVEDQERADKRLPYLLQIPAKVRFLSCEPLLGAVDLQGMDYLTQKSGLNEYPFRVPKSFRSSVFHGIHWVICGGESGPKARPMHPDWARSLRDQCAAAGVPFLFKQWGEWTQRCLLKIDGKPFGGSADFANLDPMCTRWPHVLRMCSCGGDTRTDAGPLPMCQCEDSNDLYVQKVGKNAAGRLLDGQEHNGFPNP